MISEQSSTKSTVSSDSERAAEHNFVKRFVQDQKMLWSSPLHIKGDDLPWLTGAAAGTALLVGSDTAIAAHVSGDHAKVSQQISNGGIALFAGAAGAFYLGGALKQDEHAKETGLLTGEAAINALAINSALQMAFQRVRPGETHAGGFFVGGSSFPSNHSAVAWAAASVIAHEYPGWGTKILSYGLASTVSLTRISGQKHFTSDVFVGSALGWLVGEQIYRKRHDQDLTGASWGTFTSSAEYSPNPMRNASAYVPLDSWVYPALDRLAALGEAPAGMHGLRPWTRLECAGIVAEAVEAAENESVGLDGALEELREEFKYEFAVLQGERNANLRVDSVYTRFTEISGPPLTDSFHFGQTTINDYGRPFREGPNLVTGVSGEALAGPFAIYVRGEYQHSPSAPAFSEGIRTATADADGLPVAPGVPFNAVNRFRLLDSYAALNFSNWQASFGKQSFWWGPNRGGELTLSNNAEPMYALSLTRVAPLKLPSILGKLGDFRTSVFLGQLQGYNFLRLGQTFVLNGSYERTIKPQPYIWGGKFSFRPTPNFEFGLSMTTVFAGLGRPMTLSTFLHTFSTGGDLQPLEPGDRRSGFDFSYRIPGLRKWLVLYNGSMTEDEPSPIAYPRRSAINPGIYLPQIPKLRRLDFRAEAVYTDLPNDPRTAVFYTNAHYAGGYRNYGQIMGSWVGPQGRGLQLWSTYWFSGLKKLQLGYRNQWVDPAYVGGGSLNDYSARYQFSISRSLLAETWVQYERWNFPIVSKGPNSNLAISVQLTYKPLQGRKTIHD